VAIEVASSGGKTNPYAAIGGVLLSTRAAGRPQARPDAAGGFQPGCGDCAPPLGNENARRRCGCASRCADTAC